MISSWKKKIAEAIKSIPEKKEKLREAFDSLQPYSSSLPTLQWKDLVDHFAAIERSIDERFKALQDNLKDDGDVNGGEDEEDQQEEDAKALSSAAAAAADVEATPRPELRSFCANMDANSLRFYIIDNRNDFVSIMNELAPALRCAPDPALLVLNAVKVFYPSSNPHSYCRKSAEIIISRKKCIDLLEKLHLISPNFSPCVRDMATKLAIDWKSMIPTSGNFYLEALGFLQLIASYNIVSEFPVDDVLDLFTSVSRGNLAVDLLKNLGLTDKLPDLIQKLKSKGRQVDAAKFICAFDMVDKFPPVPLLKFYIQATKKRGQELRMKRNNALQAQHEAFSIEIDALKSVLEVVEEYKLESAYSHENLANRIAQLECSVKKIAKLRQEKVEKKRIAESAAASNPEQLLQQNKRPRPSSSKSAAVIAANTNPPSTQTHPQLGLADRPPYMGVAGPVTYNGYNLSGLTQSYGSSPYP